MQSLAEQSNKINQAEQAKARAEVYEQKKSDLNAKIKLGKLTFSQYKKKLKK